MGLLLMRPAGAFLLVPLIFCGTTSSSSSSDKMMTLFEAKRRGLCLGISDPLSSPTASSAAEDVGGVVATDTGRDRRSMNTSGIRPDGEGFAVPFVDICLAFT